MKTWFALVGVVVVTGAAAWPKSGTVAGAAPGNVAVQTIPAGQRQAGHPAEKGATYYALEAQTTRLTTRFRDGHVAVTERGLIGDVRTTVRDQAGNERGRLRLNRIDDSHDTLNYEPSDGTPLQVLSDPNAVKPTLDWASRQAYGLAKDGTANLVWDNGTMRPRAAARRDLENEVSDVETVWANGLVAKVTRQTYSRRELSPGRAVEGPALVSELTLNGVPAGVGVWFVQDQVYAYHLPGLTNGLVFIAPEHLKRDYGGWGFVPDTTWVNLQTIALHHFKTLTAKNGFVAKSCEPPAPSRLAQFFMPTLHANDDGCDGLHWLDGTIVRGCCDDHDRCYSKDGCTAKSWWKFWSSWSCDVCNAVVVACFAGGGNPDPRCLGRLIC